MNFVGDVSGKTRMWWNMMESHLETLAAASGEGVVPKGFPKGTWGKKNTAVSRFQCCVIGLWRSGYHVAILPLHPGEWTCVPQKVGWARPCRFRPGTKAFWTNLEYWALLILITPLIAQKKGCIKFLAPLDATDCTPRGKTYKVGPIALWIFIVMNKFYALVIFSNKQKYCLVIKHGNEQSTIYSWPSQL